MSKFMRTALIFGLGASFYILLEILWRGYTHWTMSVTGGLCLISIYSLDSILSGVNLFKKCFIGATAICIYEFVVGCIVNIGLGWNVWDYSERPGNLLGQVCPLFFILWFLLCFPLYRLIAILRKGFGTYA